MRYLSFLAMMVLWQNVMAAEAEKKIHDAHVFCEEQPRIVTSLETFVGDKLGLGCGHIEDFDEIPQVYHKGGGYELRDDINGSCAYHAHKGWYFVSMEVNKAFGSDMVLDLLKPLHRQALFLKERWGLIYAEGLNPKVLTPELFQSALYGLKSGGFFVFNLPFEVDVKGEFTVVKGPSGSAFRPDQDSFESFESMVAAYRALLQKLGYAELRVEPGNFEKMLYRQPKMLEMARQFVQMKDFVARVDQALREKVEPKGSEFLAKLDPLFSLDVTRYYFLAIKR